MFYANNLATDAVIDQTPVNTPTARHNREMAMTKHKQFSAALGQDIGAFLMGSESLVYFHQYKGDALPDGTAAIVFLDKKAFAVSTRDFKNEDKVDPTIDPLVEAALASDALRGFNNTWTQMVTKAGDSKNAVAILFNDNADALITDDKVKYAIGHVIRQREYFAKKEAALA